MDNHLDQTDLAFVGWIARNLRLGVVEELLAGNDTSCFTTQQYADAYQRKMWASGFISKGPLPAETHLRSLSDVVREVRPGVWAAVGIMSDG